MYNPEGLQFIKVAVPNATTILLDSPARNMTLHVNIILKHSQIIFENILLFLNISYETVIKVGWFRSPPPGAETLLYDGTADVGLIITEVQSYFVESGLAISLPIYVNKLMAIYRKPTSSRDILLSPLDFRTWISVSGFGLMSLIIGFLLEKRVRFPKALKFSLFALNVFWLLFSSIYSGVFVSFLSVDHKFFKNFDEIKASSIPIYASALNSRSHAPFLMELTGETDMYKVLLEKDDMAKMIDQNKYFVWLSLPEEFNRYYSDERENKPKDFFCEEFEYHIIEGESFRHKAAYLLPRNTPFREPLNRMISRILETGLGSKYIKDFLKEASIESPSCSASYFSNRLSEIHWMEVYYAFILISGICILSLFILAFEKYLKSLANQN